MNFLRCFNLKILSRVLVFLFATFVCLSGNSQSEAALWGKKGANWKLNLNTLYAHDNNVVTAPDDPALRPATMTQLGDSIFEWSGTAIYNYKPTTKFSLRMDYDIDMTIHTELNEYDLTSQMFTLSPTYKFNPSMNVQLMYSYIWNIVDGSNFSGVHFVSPNFYYMHEKFGLTRIYYTYKDTDNWDFDSRDTSHNAVGMNHFFFFSDYKGRVTFAYEYSNDNSDGPAFDRDLNDFSLKVKTPLLYEIVLDAECKYSVRSYETRLADDGVEKRKDYQQRYAINLSRVLIEKVGVLERLTFYGKFRHTFNRSNLDIREYASDRFDFGFRGTF